MEKRHFIVLQLTAIVILGLIYIKSIPLFDAPDETSHFLRAFGLAQGQLVLRDHPVEAVSFIFEQFRQNYPDIENSMLDHIQDELSKENDRIPNIASNTSVYSFVPYIPHGITIKVFSIFADPLDNLETLVYICRFITLAAFAMCFLLAVLLAPGLSWPFFWLACTPMVMAQYSTVSIDYMILGPSLLLISASAGRTSDKCFLATAFGAVFFLFQAKFPYIPVVIMAYAIICCVRINVKFRLYALTLACVVSLILSLGWMLAAASQGVNELLLDFLLEHMNPEINPQAQLAWIISNPLSFLNIVLFNLYSKSAVLAHQFVGVLGWLTISLDIKYVWFWLVLGGFYVLGADRLEFTFKTGLFLFITSVAAAALCTLLTMISMYLICDSVGGNNVSLQGRYFHPMAGLILFGLTAVVPLRISRRTTLYQAMLLIGGLFINYQMILKILSVR